MERMKQFKNDVMKWKDYDFTVINDKLEKCYNSIVNFISSQKNMKLNSKYNKKSIKRHIDYLIS